MTDLARRTALSPRVTEAMRRVPRHLFVDAPPLEAYEDKVIGLTHGQSVSQPYVVAVMSEALELSGRERVLEIGTGSGYQAAILSLLARQVSSIEVIPALAETGRRRLDALGFRVDVRLGDGYEGWPARAPFDRVILTAAPAELPAALFDQLASGGLLVAPVGETRGTQALVRVRKTTEGPVCDELGLVSFVPMVHAPES